MRHITSTYRDGYQDIEYCLNCGKEGRALHSKCEGGDMNIRCVDCGHEFPPYEDACKNCQEIREKFLVSINKQNSAALRGISKLKIGKFGK